MNWSGIFNSENKFFSFIEKWAELMGISLLWLVCCIPVVTIVPSTAALYYTVVKVVRRERSHTVQSFFHSFRDNLRQGIPMTILLGGYTGLCVWIVSVVDAAGVSVFVGYGARALLVPVLVLVPYLCPVLSRFRLGIGMLLKYALHMSVRHILTTLLLLLLFGVTALGLWYCPAGLILLPGLCGWLSSFALERVLKRYTPKDTENSSTDEWYLE